MLRALLLAAIALAVAAPSANAALADRYVPWHGAEDGVKVRSASVGFDAKAARIYRRLAGREVTVECFGEEPLPGGGTRHYGGVGSMDAPRKRHSLYLLGGDVCSYATKQRRGEDDCIRGDDSPYPTGCVRLIVARTERGRVYLDRFSRAFEIAHVANAEDPAQLGPDVTVLPSADAAPPAGKVGYFVQGTTKVVAALLEDGTRWFVRTDGDVTTTNVPDFVALWSQEIRTLT